MNRALANAGLVAIALAACARPPAQLGGRWEGTIALDGAARPARLDVHGGPDAWFAFVASPDGREPPAAARNLRFDDPELSFEMAEGGAHLRFAGTLAGGAIRCTANEAGHELRLVLTRAGDAPPPPFRPERVEVQSGDVALGGELLVPAGDGPHPAVVLIHGTGRQTREEWQFVGATFARAGVAALLYDKRDVGRDPDGMDLVSLDELAGDAVAAVELLRARDDVRGDAIGLWGISQGGWVAPLAAARSPVAFVIGVSAPGVTYAEVNRFAVANRLRARGFSDADVGECDAALKQLDAHVRAGDDPAAMQARLDELRTRPWFAISTLPSRVPGPAERSTRLRWRDLDRDPAASWRRIRSPVLLVYGDRDAIVPVQPSIDRIRAALAKAGNDRITVQLFAGADHELQRAPGYLELLTDWTRRQVGR